MKQEIDNLPSFGFDEEPQGYGAFGSFDELEGAIALRQALGKNPLGSAIIYEGARIIRDENNGEHLEYENPGLPPHPIPVHVGPGGGWVIPE
mgnify:CR=1 FL=1